MMFTNTVCTNPVIDAQTAVKLAEINVKAMTTVVNNQTKLFNELLSTGLGQLKTVQSVKDVCELVEENTAYSQVVKTKLRKTYNANSTVIEGAGKKGFDLISRQQKAQPASSSK